MYDLRTVVQLQEDEISLRLFQDFLDVIKP